MTASSPSPAHRFTTRDRRWYRRMRRGVLAGALALIVGVWATVYHQQGEIRAQAYRALAIEAETLARVYAEAVRRVIGQIDTALLVLREEYRHQGGLHLDGFASTSLVLREGPLAGEVLQIAVIGPDGMLLFSDLKRPARQVDLSDREHFRVHLDNTRDDLFISKPVLGRVSGKWSIQLTRRMEDDTGRFMGVLVMSVDPAVFADSTSELMPLAEGVLTLVGRDRTVLSRHPDGPSYLGKQLPESAQGYLGDRPGAHLRASLLDGRTRMIAYAPVADHGLHAGVSLETHATEAIAAARQGDWISGGGAVTLLVLIAAVASVRSLRLRAAWQAELAAQREHLADAQAAARMGSWEWRRADDAFEWSAGMARVLGLADPVSPPARERLIACIHPDDRARFEAAMEDCRRDGKAFELEHRICRADGSEAIVLSTVHLERDDPAAPVLGVMIDVTERRRLEASLQQAEQRWNWALEAARDGVWDWDVARDRIWYSERCATMVGYAVEDLGRDFGAWRNNVHPDDLPALLTALERHFADPGEPYQPEFRLRARDGRYRWILARGNVFERGPDGTPLRMLGTQTDITDRKEAELAARIADELVRQTAQPIVVTDTAGLILRCNPAFCRTVGFTEEELVGRPASACTRSGRHETDFYRAMWKALHAEGRWEGEIWNKRRSGEIFPEWLSITAIRDCAGRIEQFVGIYTDITERKRHEETMWRAANYDSLTELPNRLLFADRLRAGIARARRSGSRLAVLYVDLDRFKAVNDTFGHQAGDTVLRAVARGLAVSVREDDTVARIAGDEFNALLQNLSDPSAVDRVAGAMLRAARAPIDIGGQSVTVSCSIGIAVYPDDAETPEALAAAADAAMYRVKQGGRDGYARHAGEAVTLAENTEEIE